MSFKTIIVAALFTAATGAAIAQQTQQQQQQNPLRPNQPTQPTAPRAAQPTTPAPAPAQQPARAAQPAAPAAQPAQPAAQSTLINLNTATKEQLDTLPQIGEARALAIIAKRPYKDWNDFVSKNVIPSNAEAAIKDKVRFR